MNQKAFNSVENFSDSSLIPHPSSLELAEAEGVEPTRDALPDCLADSSGYQFRHASEVKKSWRRVEDSNSYELSLASFQDWCQTVVAYSPRTVDRSIRIRTEIGGFGDTPCCQLHHAPKFEILELRAVGLAPTKSVETPDLQSGAFAARPRTRKNFAIVKKHEGGR